MAVRASLVLGADGSTTKGATSEAISSPEDRVRFLSQRRNADCIVIGGNTARHERYAKTPVDLIIVSHTSPDLLLTNPHAHWWNMHPSEAIEKARSEFGSTIAVEGGIAFISELLTQGLIDELSLSVTEVVGGENLVQLEQLLSHFSHIEKSSESDTIFYECR